MFKVNELLKATGGKLASGPVAGGVKGISIDSRTIKRGEAFIAIKGVNLDGHNFIDAAIKKGANCIIREATNKKYRTKGLACIEVKDTTVALGDIAKFRRAKFDIPVIAVTGSNGKTTTKEMIYWVLSQRFGVLKNIGTKNNQIGLPQTLLNLNSSFRMAVLEIGTSHPGEVEYLARIAQPDIAIITNCGPAHLEYFKDLGGVFKEKSALLRNLKQPGIAILNADDELLKERVISKSTSPIIFGFGIKGPADFSATNIRVLNNRIEFLLDKKYRFTLKTLGYYNIYNALAAIAVARLFGMGYQDIADRLGTFNFLENRLKLVELNKVKFINDTYNSNPFSLRQALDALRNFRTRGRKIFVMGDMLELGKNERLFHRQAGRSIVGACDIFITVGQLSKIAASAARRSGFDAKNIFTCESNIEARDILFKDLSVKPNDIVLVKGSRAMRMEEVFPT